MKNKLLKVGKMKKQVLKLAIVILSVTVNTDSFAQWETVYFPDTNINLPCLYSVAFRDISNGLTVGYSPIYDTLFYIRWEGYILRTTNNGTNWDTILTIDSIRFNDVVYSDINTAFTVGEHQNETGIIARSIDSGNTWDTTIISEELDAISFPCNNIGYAVGANGTILKTIDIGINWTTQNSTVSNRLNSVFFINDSTGFAGGGNFILKTINGGYNWVSQGVDSGYVVDIFFPSDSIGYLLTSSQSDVSHYVFKTIDCGNSWNLYSTIISNGLYLSSMYFTNDTIGYICGQFQMYKTTNGGLNWNLQSSSPPGMGDMWMDDIMDVFFLNIDTGFIVGNSQFYRTNTGGDTLITIITEIVPHKKIEVYPNPFFEYTLIVFENNKNEKHILTLYNITGQAVKQIDNITTEKIKIEREDLVNGIYFFQLQKNKETIGSGKLIIK